MSQTDNLPEAEGDKKEVQNSAATPEESQNPEKDSSSQVNAQPAEEQAATPVPKKEETVEATKAPEEKKVASPDLETTDSDSETASEALKSTETEGEKVEKKSPEIPYKSYETMGVEVLVGEAENLLKSYPAYKLRSHFGKIRKAFNKKMDAIEAKAKEAFVAEGGNAIDFYFENPTKQKFNKVYHEYRKQMDAYQKNLEAEEKKNLQIKQRLIEELKALYNEPAESNSQLFKEFKRIKAEWLKTGHIPKKDVRDVNRTYYFHLDNFYEFLNLNHELRQLDYDHNLEVRHAILKRAEELTKEENVQKALNELQYLHTMWKEEAVPVAEEHREPTWQKFKVLTQAIHDKKELLNEEERKKQEQNLEKKKAIINEILLYSELPEDLPHSEWQKKIKTFEELRSKFMAIGRVPRAQNQEVWSAFKDASRDFNRKKNKFYKGLKSKQSENLDKKQALLDIAEQNKDSEDWQEAVALFKKIQSDWRNIGHVPRKHSDRIWKEFKAACNHFFERYKQRNQKTNKRFEANLANKQEIIDKLIAFKHEDKEATLAFANKMSLEWSQSGKVPRNASDVSKAYNKALKTVLGKLDMSEEEMGQFQNDSLIRQIQSSGDEDLLYNERRKLRNKIDEIEKEVAQLENNINFFANADESNPLLKDVFQQIQTKRSQLTEAEVQLRQLSSIQFDEEEGEEE